MHAIEKLQNVLRTLRPHELRDVEDLKAIFAPTLEGVPLPSLDDQVFEIEAQTLALEDVARENVREEGLDEEKLCFVLNRYRVELRILIARLWAVGEARDQRVAELRHLVLQ